MANHRKSIYIRTELKKVIVCKCRVCGWENEVTMDLCDVSTETACAGPTCTCDLIATDEELVQMEAEFDGQIHATQSKLVLRLLKSGFFEKEV